MLNTIMSIIQIWLLCVMGIYFFTLMRTQNATKSSINKDSLTELNKLKKLQNVSLTEPLSEITRPDELAEIIGQKDGIKALKAALCGKNPQHVIIYGPPGVGKTAAARTVLNEAKKSTSRRPSGLRKTTLGCNSLAHRTTWLRSDFFAAKTHSTL